MAHFRLSLGFIIDFFIYSSTGIHLIALVEESLKRFESFVFLHHFIIQFSSSMLITIGTGVLIFYRIKLMRKKLRDGDKDEDDKGFFKLF